MGQGERPACDVEGYLALSNFLRLARTRDRGSMATNRMFGNYFYCGIFQLIADKRYVWVVGVSLCCNEECLNSVIDYATHTRPLVISLTSLGFRNSECNRNPQLLDASFNNHYQNT